MQKLEEAAKASDISAEEAARNISEGMQTEKSAQSQRR
jgi:Xaa-Pro aminopeptidase